MKTPIVVDLDGTLIVGDSLDEGLAVLAFARPLALGPAALALLRGRAAFKRAVAAEAGLEVHSVPVRQDLFDWLLARRDEGCELHLVTAADQSVADAAAERFGLFASAVGSGGDFNLKGPAKRDYLLARFPDGFVYCGDSHADIPVFLAAQGAVLCDAPAAAEAAVSKAGVPVMARFTRQPLAPRDLTKMLRVHQWSKNVLVFVPLILGHVYNQPEAVLKSVLGFLIMSLLASGTYMANDLADLEADRFHRSKSRRAFASGRLSLRVGFLLSPLLTLVAFVSAWLLSPPFAGGLLFYFVLTTLYSWKLKRIPLLDVFVIGTLFTSRIVMGAALLGLTQSVWLLSFAMSLFFSLALAKRHVEIVTAGERGEASLARRGYRASDWPLSLVLGIGGGLVSVLIMMLYMTADAAPSGFYRHGQWLYAAPAALTLWIMRIWLLSHRGELHDDPVVFALKDKASLALAAAVGVAFLAAV